MDKQTFRPIIAMLIALMPNFGHAQGWLQVYDYPPASAGNKVEEIPGGYRLSGLYEILTDGDGDLVQASLVQPPAMPGLQLSDGNYLVAGTAQNPDPDYESDVTLVKKTPIGDTLWAKSFPELKPQGPHTILELPSGELMVIGIHTVFAAGINFNNLLFVMKTDASGNLISFNLHLQNASYHLSINEVYFFPDGTPLVYFKHPQVFTPEHNLCGLLKLDSDGNKEWQEGFGSGNTQTGETLFDIRIAPNGRVSFLNRHTYISTSSTDFELHKRNADGSVVFDVYAGSAGVPLSLIAFAPLVQIPVSDDKTLVIRQFVHFQLPQHRIELRMIGNDGELVWEKSFPGQLAVQDGLENAGGRFVLTGKTLQGKVFLLESDTSGCVFYGTATGQVFIDENQNCQLDTGEQAAPLATYTVINDLALQYGQPDSNGYFTISVLDDNANLVFSSNNPYVQLCQDTFPLTFTDTLTNDTVFVPAQILHECPLMKPQLTLQNVRPCMPTTCMIRCSNFGTAPAEGATMNLIFPTGFEFVSATVPITSQLGNELVFELGDLEIGEHIQFSAQFDVDCAVQIGDEVCLEAHAFPDTICSPAVIGTPFFTEICRIATSSFDPNQKTVFPQGEGTNHWLPTDSTITYLIDFQNTGTDTAFRVVVRDTLSPFLDPTSLSPSPASHPYALEVLPNGILKFVFDNIMLPDSNVNEAASHGFVQFEINLRKNTPPYSIIENTAGIYFDFNEAILTNTVFHTTFNPLVFNEIDTSICEGTLFFGQPIVADTTLTDTLFALMGDSILYYHISVLPTSFENIDISICQNEVNPFSGMVYDDPGEYSEEIVFQNQSGCDSTVFFELNVLPVFETEINLELIVGDTFMGIPIYSDTVFIENLIAENACDSTVITAISVVSSTNVFLKKDNNLNVFPNPTSGDLFIGFELNEPVYLEIKIADLLGREIAVVSENELFQKGKQVITVNSNHWPSGVYIIQFHTGNNAILLKVIKHSYSH